MSREAEIELLKAIGHPVRVRILDALREGERNVGEIEDATAIAQPGLSQQLAILRKAGLVTTRKDAKLVFYALDSAAIRTLAASLEKLAGTRDIAPRRGPSPGAANFARVAP